MKARLIILSILLCLSSHGSYAQEVDKYFPTQLFKYLTELNDRIELFFTKEKADNLNRNLGYFKTDLKNYLVVRKNLMEQLEANEYNINNPGVKQTVTQLSTDLQKLATRLSELNAYVETVLPENDNIYNISFDVDAQRSRYISKLEDLLAGKQVDKRQLKADGRDIYNRLSKSVKLAGSIQKKLKEQYNI
jgi:hypothetical protein